MFIALIDISILYCNNGGFADETPNPHRIVLPTTGLITVLYLILVSTKDERLVIGIGHNRKKIGIIGGRLRLVHK